MAPLIQNAKQLKNKDQVLPNWHIFVYFVPEENKSSENNHISAQFYLKHNIKFNMSCDSPDLECVKNRYEFYSYHPKILKCRKVVSYLANSQIKIS